MEKQAPSIFNDVIGPVMRGPSSSHVAGAARIGDLLRQMAKGDLKKVTVDFDVNGSLAESHEGHGTDMGFACGILGVPLTDLRVDPHRRDFHRRRHDRDGGAGRLPGLGSGGLLRILLPAAGGGEREFRDHGGAGETVPADRFSGAVHGHGGSWRFSTRASAGTPRRSV